MLAWIAYACLSPVVAALPGSLFLKESFNIRMALGRAIILAGVAVVQLKPKINIAVGEPA